MKVEENSIKPPWKQIDYFTSSPWLPSSSHAQKHLSHGAFSMSSAVTQTMDSQDAGATAPPQFWSFTSQIGRSPQNTFSGKSHQVASVSQSSWMPLSDSHGEDIIVVRLMFCATPLLTHIADLFFSQAVMTVPVLNAVILVREVCFGLVWTLEGLRSDGGGDPAISAVAVAFATVDLRCA